MQVGFDTCKEGIVVAQTQLQSSVWWSLVVAVVVVAVGVVVMVIIILICFSFSDDGTQPHKATIHLDARQFLLCLQVDHNFT